MDDTLISIVGIKDSDSSGLYNGYQIQILLQYTPTFIGD